MNKSYAACRDHAVDALDGMVGLENVAVRDVSNHDRSPGASTYTCHCGQPAVFFLIERLSRDNGQHAAGT